MSKDKIYYNSNLKNLARDLRKQGVYSEVLLWNELKGKKLMGYDFHRQKPIDNYIVDFFCHDLKLAIEIDGDSHKDKVEYDTRRQAKLEEIGITVIHFEHYYVIKHLGNVVNEIKNWVVENKNQHTPS